MATLGGSYLLYKLLPGPTQLVIERYLGVDKHSSPTSLLTYHLTNTSFMSVATNLAILGTIGRYHYLTHGAGSFLTVTGCGALGGSLATANAVSKNEHYVAASSNAIGAALVTFHAFKTPKLFTQFRYLKFLPLGWVALMGIYGIKYGDEGVLAGAAGGYAAFLLGIW